MAKSFQSVPCNRLRDRDPSKFVSGCIYKMRNGTKGFWKHEPIISRVRTDYQHTRIHRHISVCVTEIDLSVKFRDLGDLLPNK